MNMAMYEQTQLPTPYPVGVNGMSGWTDWLNPFAVESVQSYTGPAIPNQRYADVMAGKPMPYTTKSGQKVIFNAAGPQTSFWGDFFGGKHDAQHDTQSLIKDVTGYDSAPLAWLTNNIKWIALLGGGVLVVKYLSKRN